MQNIIKIVSGLTLCASAVAYASGDVYMQPISYANPGFSIGGEVGYGYLNTPEDTYPEDVSYHIINTQSTVEHGYFLWGVHGAYEWQTGQNTLLGLQLGYKNLGKSSYNYDITTHFTAPQPPIPAPPPTVRAEINLDKNIKEQAVDLLATAKYFVWKGANVFAQAGVAWVNSQTNQNVDVNIQVGDNAPITHHVDMLSGSHSIWRFEPEMAIGAGYAVTKNFNVYAFYDHIGDGSDSGTIWDHLLTSKVYGSNSMWAGLSWTASF